MSNTLTPSYILTHTVKHALRAGFLILFILTCYLGKTQNDYIKGITVVAPPHEFAEGPMQEVKLLNADWVAVIPYGYSRVGNTNVHYNTSRQWWGERYEGVQKTIRLAKSENLKIMLKPQIYVPSSWPGGIDFDTEAAWSTWEANYSKYIMEFALLAEREGVELFSIGTEFSISSQKRYRFWIHLIEEIRKVYSGQLTYSANWDEYLHITFWDHLDFIGVDAHFPLLEKNTPEVDELVKAWLPYKNQLKSMSQLYKKSILFTEYGYLSVDRCAYNTWELESNVRNRKINEMAQANAITALFETFKNEDFWAGGFYWKWFPNMHGHEGYVDRDYTFQGKLGQGRIIKFFSDSRK